MRFAQRVFLIAGIYGVAVLLPQYFMEERIGRDFPPPVTHAEHFYGFIGVALAWQFAFLLIAKDPVRFRPMMPVGILEKVSFGGAAIVLFAQNRLPFPILLAGVLDLVLAGLFLLAWRATPRE
ncbi:MAG TPA: hypothetical protein VE974_03100 [Thermoanaerobaculia bacterium]|nr:hypothetical protein [Thermoanaerobaculia bacterium]